MNDSLTAVPGLSFGAWTHPSGTTGVSVTSFDAPARAALFRAGFGVSTRQVDGLEHPHISGRIHAVCFTGGSAFGLGVADGVVAGLEARGVGFPTGVAPVPIVPTAVIFDLPVAAARPDAAAGRAALEAASREPVRNGRIGAGAGATVAKWAGLRLPGGVGTAAAAVGDTTVGVFVVLNAAGSIRDPESGAWLAGGPPGSDPPFARAPRWSQNTTLVLVATDAGLSRDGCAVVARMAAAGMARAIHPVFSPFDGDLVLAASTGEGVDEDPARVGLLGSVAADLVARAIPRALRPPS